MGGGMGMPMGGGGMGQPAGAGGLLKPKGPKYYTDMAHV